MTPSLLLLAVGATLAQPARAYPAAAHLVVDVVARQDPVHTELLGLKEIEGLRDRYGRPVRHRTLGLYASAFFYTVQAVGDGDTAECRDRKLVVQLVLADRDVAIAREATELPCLSDVVTQHYLRHVALDQEAFDRLTSRIRNIVTSTEFSVRADEATAQGSSVVDVIRSAVEAELPAYDDDRSKMQAEADSDAEVARIRDACS